MISLTYVLCKSFKMENIVLHVYYTGAPGRASAFPQKMRRTLRSEIINEPGCLQYDYFTSLADGDTVLLVERWRDHASLDCHSAGEPMAKLKQMKDTYCLSTRVERYE